MPDAIVFLAVCAAILLVGGIIGIAFVLRRRWPVVP